MKILIVSHFFPPQHTAGAEKRAFGYAMTLQKMGYTVQVVCSGDWDNGPRHWNGYSDEMFQGIPVRRVHMNWTAAQDPNRALYDNPLVEAQFNGWLDEWQPDVVHIISLITLTAGVVRTAKKRGLPVVFTLTDFWVICPKINLVHGDGSLCDGQVTEWDCLKCLLVRTKAYRGLNRVLSEAPTRILLELASRAPRVNRLRGLRGMALNMAERRRVMAEIAGQVDCVTAPSAFLGSVIDKNRLFPYPVRIIHSGHDLAWLKDMPEKQPSTLLRLGFIGQLIPVKGVELLIRAFQDTGSEGKAQLLIFGDNKKDPQYASTLQALAEERGDIQFMGAFSHHQLGTVLSNIDILVVPSLWHENNPRVIQEAFASRTPVVASDVGGIAEFVRHGENGLLYTYDQQKDLTAKLRMVIDDPTLIGRLQAGIRPVRSIADEMQAYTEIYQNLMGQRI
jgi:glycosyltransferase involved in cell wall biosynthesis